MILTADKKNDAVFIGKRYGRLTVVKRATNSNSGIKRWECLCDCGRVTVSHDGGLKRGKSKSCGCLQRENMSKRTKTHGWSRTEKYKREFSTWASIKDRCYNKKHKQFQYWGGRGIIICDRWLNSFENFLLDMGKRPSDKHSLDRIDNNGNYEPSNCRWATTIQQSRNKRINHWVEYNGKRMVITDWANLFGVQVAVLGTMLKTKSMAEIEKHLKAKHEKNRLCRM